MRQPWAKSFAMSQIMSNFAILGISYSEIWSFFKQISPNLPNREIRAGVRDF